MKVWSLMLLFEKSKRGLTNGGLNPNFQRNSGGNPSWKIGPFRGLIGVFPGCIGLKLEELQIKFYGLMGF